jgi:hypothetical protein
MESYGQQKRPHNGSSEGGDAGEAGSGSQEQPPNKRAQLGGEEGRVLPPPTQPGSSAPAAGGAD